MSAEIALWRVDGEAKRVKPSSMPLESRLEEIIESDPAMLGQQLMLIGRQVATAYGKFIDLLAVDGDGYLHVIELKRDRTPRDVVAQVLDYGSWVQGLSNDDVREIHANYRNSDAGSDSFDEAFERSFGTNAPDSLNGSHVLTVVASEMDPATERLVTYLAGGYDVPINVLFFAYYEDEGRKYIARTWLIDDSTIAANKSVSKGKSKQAPWNGQDWYVSFGEEPGQRNWEDARKFGFVSAGGKSWFSRTLRQVPVGARVFAYLPKVGYAGVGEVVGEAAPYAAAVTSSDPGRPFAELDLTGHYVYDIANPSPDEDYDEWVLPVTWIKTVDRDHALQKRGLFANQNSACKLRNEHTLNELSQFFGLDD